MKKLHKDRLLKLAKFLREKVPDEHFDLDSFINTGDYSYDRHLKDLPEIAKGKQRGCGTTACAVGWCPAVFPRYWEWQTEMYSEYGVRLKDSAHSSPFGDAEEFFDLSSTECNYLFDPYYYPERRIGKEEVARRIEQFVKRDGVPRRVRI
jgi:hypothetical protein